MNISSVIVIPGPDHVRQVLDGLAGLPGVEVAATSPEGKIIATIESSGDSETIRTYEAMSVLDGVLSAAMVFHQQEADPESTLSVAA